MTRRPETRINVRCDDCGDHELPIQAVLLVLCDGRPDLNTYAFRCPQCFAPVSKDAQPGTVALLRSVEVQEVHWHIPAEVFEPHDGPPIGYDDLIDFCLGLRGDFASELAA